MIEKLVNFLLDGKFSLLYGHRQSGKSTTAYAVKEWLENEHDKEVYIITFSSGIVVDEGLNEFWHSVCAKIQSLNANRFKYNVFDKFARASASSNTFESLFSRHNNPSAKDCIIIIDEASYLAGNQKITESFISSLRVLKDGRGQFNVFSFMLVGTEIIREFLLSHQRPDSVSIISPFSDEASTVSSCFSEVEISMLLFQYSAENNFTIDIKHIAEDIYYLTLGHKGLVGLCCSFLETRIMEGKNELSFDEWNEATYALPEFIRGKATYESIVRTLPSLSEGRKQILAKVLRSKTDTVSHVSTDCNIRFIILLFTFFFFVKG
jgi:AAA domain